jgi:hypothetical protein
MSMVEGSGTKLGMAQVTEFFRAASGVGLGCASWTSGSH